MDINRKAAYQTLLEIEKNSAYSNIELNKQIEELKPDSPGFVRELTYGVVENKIYIDYLLTKLIPKGLKGVKKQALTLLRMGIYQLEFMDSVPDYAAINETVNLAKKVARGRDGFINGVLRGYLKKRSDIKLPSKEENLEEYLSTKYSFDPWIVKLWISQFGDDAESIIKASNETPELSVRVNLTKISTAELEDNLKSKGFDVRRGKLSERVLFVKGSNLLDTDEFKMGYFSVQDESSVVAGELLAPVKGDMVLDICAAPGGKTLCMAEIMENEGRINAYDIYEHKLKLIKNESGRLGLDIINIDAGDGTKLNEALVEVADKVLVDGPCSGLGVIRRKPEIKYKVLDDNGKGLAEKQLQILENASKYVKNGGYLLYSTCTINKYENEDVVNAFLNKNPNFEAIESKQLIPGKDETDGFYMCKLRKNS